MRGVSLPTRTRTRVCVRVRAPGQAVLVCELRPLERELASRAEVYDGMQRALAQVDEAEGRAAAATAEAETCRRSARDAEWLASEARAEAEAAVEAAQQAQCEAEERATAAARRAEVEEAAKAAAVRVADETVASVDAGASALSHAVSALHRWLDGVVTHGALNGAAQLDVMQHSVRGASACPALRAAHASLQALQARLHFVSEELLRTRAAAAKGATEAAAATTQLTEAAGRSQQQTRRAEKLHALVLAANERVHAARAEAAAAQAAVETGVLMSREAEGRAREAAAALSARHQVAANVAVQLSDMVRRSADASFDAASLPLCDSACVEWEWERLALALSSVAGHVCHYWANSQREVTQLRSQLEDARAVANEKEASLARAATIACGLRQAAAYPHAPPSGRTPPSTTLPVRTPRSRVGGARVGFGPRPTDRDVILS